MLCILRFFPYSLALQLLEHLLDFDWLVHYDECSNVSATNFNLDGVILCIIIGDDVQCISI